MSHGKIKLIISTTAGDLEAEFPPNQPLHAVKQEAMGKLHLDPSTSGDFVFSVNGMTLDENKTLAELGLHDGEVLILERKEVVKV